MIISPEAAVLESRKAAAEFLKLPRWGPALSSSNPGVPVLVQRLDRNDGYYYVVPYVNRAVVTARLNIDAISSRLNEAAGIDKAGDSLPQYVDPARELTRWDGETIELPSHRVRLIRASTVGQHPIAVWQPCRESMSPFKPFYLFSIGNEVVYLRVDGQRFTRLTIGPA